MIVLLDEGLELGCGDCEKDETKSCIRSDLGDLDFPSLPDVVMWGFGWPSFITVGGVEKGGISGVLLLNEDVRFNSNLATIAPTAVL